MINLILFNRCESPQLSVHDDLLFRKKWESKEKIISIIQTDVFKRELKQLFDNVSISTIIYKTHDSLGRLLPSRDENGKFIKKSN